jgi:hypothetical protein
VEACASVGCEIFFGLRLAPGCFVGSVVFVNTETTYQNPGFHRPEAEPIVVDQIQPSPVVPVQSITPVSEAVVAAMVPVQAEAPVKEYKKRGRKPLPPAEKARRKELNLKRQEARRHAMKVLADRHPEEFEALLELQLMAQGIS